MLIGLSAYWYGGYPPEATAAIAVLSWWTVLLGAGTGLLPVAELGGRAIALLLLFLALALLTALSIDWAVDGGRAFVKAVQFSSLFGVLTLALMCSRRACGRDWAGGITVGLFFIVMLAAISRFFPGIGDDVELTANLSGVAGRLSWPLGYWNATGACAAMCAAGLVWFGSNAKGKTVRNLSIACLPLAGLVVYLTSSRGATVALLVGVAVLIGFGPKRRTLGAGAAIGLSGAMVVILPAAQMYALVHAENSSDARSEGIILLTIAVVVSATVFLAWRTLEPRLARLAPWKPGRWWLVSAAVAALVVVIAANPVERYQSFVAPVGSETEVQKSENTTTAHLLSASGNGRIEFWSNAVDAFESEPIRGIGAGGYETFYAANRESGFVGRHTHSLPLQILAEFGVVGALIFASILGLVLVTAWQRWQVGRLRAGSSLLAVPPNLRSDDGWRTIPVLVAIGAAGGFSMSIDWTAEFPVIVAPVVIAAACLVGPATCDGGGQDQTRADSGRRNFMAVTLILVSGLSIWAASTAFGVATKMNASRQAVSNGDLVTAERVARDAIGRLEFSSEPRVQLALVQELRGDYRLALSTLDGAIERAPESSSSFLLRARILLRMDRDRAALRAYEKARSLDPSGPIFSQ